MTEVKLNALTQASENQKKFAAEAIDRLKVIVNKPEFLTKVVNAKYTWKNLWTDQGTSVKVTNQQIVDIISGGKERKTPADNVIDLQVMLAKLKSGIVGRVSPPNPLITTNTLFVDSCIEKSDSLSLAAHWMHEWLHVAGFLHKRKHVDDHDVNYTIGRLVVEIGRQLAKDKGETEDLLTTLGTCYLDTIEEHADDVNMDNVKMIDE